MTISLIAAVAKTLAGKLVIAKNGDLLSKLKQDMSFFKNLTTNGSKSHMNIVLMGRKTFNSIPERFSPLKNRINFVLTRDPVLLKLSKVHLKKLEFNDVLPYYMTFYTFCKLHKKLDHDVFVIGGGVIYNKFLDSKLDKDLVPTKLYITEISGIKFNKDDTLTYMDNFDYRWKLIGYSEKFEESNVTYRILRYGVSQPTDDGKYKQTDEFKYLELANKILTTGVSRTDRTGTGTMSLLGEQLRFDISSCFPLLTTKKVNLNAVIEELLFFCRGDTDTKILERNGVGIWKGNTSREFLDKRGLQHYPEGCMGSMYGFSWRHFGAVYHPRFADTSKIDIKNIGGFDQIKHVENLLKTDPFSRRIYISNLNPAESKNMCLEPCHTYIQFYVTEEHNQKYLSAYFTMRSSDYAIASASFNSVSYILLVYILALRCNMKPKELIYNAVDCHIYKTHIEAVKKQLLRTPRPFPKINLDESLKTKDWSEMVAKDFELIGYFHDSFIKMEMAI
jgi:thymidylate synthase